MMPTCRLQRVDDVRVTSTRCRHSMRDRHTRPLRSIAEVFRMVARRRCAILFVLVSGMVCALGAQQQETCAPAIPVNIDAGVFASDMAELLRRSGTFRSQCERLAQAPRVHVKIEIAVSLDSGRAQ